METPNKADREKAVQEAFQEQTRIRSDAHIHWLEHPVTLEMFRALNNHETQLLENPQGDALVILTAVRTVRAMRKILSDSVLFIKLSTTN